MRLLHCSELSQLQDDEEGDMTETPDAWTNDRDVPKDFDPMTLTRSEIENIYCIQIAGRVWQDPEMEGFAMDKQAAEEIAAILKGVRTRDRANEAGL